MVAQLLSYASFLRGSTVGGLEHGTLAAQLAQRGAADIASLAAAAFQDTAIGDDFRAAMQESLDTGSFRLVWVLDDAPPELVSLVGYLEYISSGIITIDLVTVTQYEVGGERVIVPQRVEPARVEPQDEGSDSGGPGGPMPVTTRGADDFLASIKTAPESGRPLLSKLAEWAKSLEDEGLARLWTTSGVTGRKMLKPCIPSVDVGLVTIWNDNGPSMSLWRSVFESHAPAAIAPVEALTGIELGVGRAVPEITDELLEALTAAYREAAKSRGAETVQSENGLEA